MRGGAGRDRREIVAGRLPSAAEGFVEAYHVGEAGALRLCQLRLRREHCWKTVRTNMIAVLGATATVNRSSREARSDLLKKLTLVCFT